MTKPLRISFIFTPAHLAPTQSVALQSCHSIDCKLLFLYSLETCGISYESTVVIRNWACLFEYSLVQCFSLSERSNLRFSLIRRHCCPPGHGPVCWVTSSAIIIDCTIPSTFYLGLWCLPLRTDIIIVNVSNQVLMSPTTKNWAIVVNVSNRLLTSPSSTS